MKTSKLLITSLLAAAAMSVPVFAGAVREVTVSGTVNADTEPTITFTSGTQGSSESITKTTSGTETTYKTFNMENVDITVSALSIEADTIVKLYSAAGENVRIASSDALIGSGTLELNRANTGTGVMSVYGIDAGVSLDNFTGTIKLSKDGTSASNAALYMAGSASKATINLSSSLTGLVISGDNVAIAGLTGVAGSSLTSRAKKNYNSGGDSGFNSSSDSYATNDATARTLTIGGSGTYSFAGSVGSATHQTSLNLTKSGTGTQTLSGTTYLGNLDVTGGNLVLSGTANIAGTTTVTGGTLDLSGGTITLANAIQNSGTVTISDTTVFNLTQTGATTLINGGTIAGVDWNSLTGFNFTYNGAAITVGRGLTSTADGVVSYDASATGKDLTWSGSASNVWETASLAGTTNKPWTSSEGQEAFYNGDSVTFNTANASVEVSGTVDPAAMTVSAATSFTGTGTISVAVANLTTSAAMMLGKNVVLDLGNISAATTKTISGTGTVKVVNTSTGHGATLTLGSDFRGTIEYSGKFNTSNGNETNNANAKFALSNGSMWGSDTITNDIHFQTNYQIGDSKETTITLNGNLTQADGTTLTIGTNVGTNITFGGRANLYHLTQSTGTLTIGGATTVTGNYQGSSGTSTYSVLTVNAGGSLSVGGDLTLRYENNNTDNIGATMNVSGEVSVDGNFWIARDGKGIVHINDGGTVVANTLTFGQRWADSEGTSKTSQVDVASGGKLIAGSIVANTDRNVNQQGVKDVDILKSSALNLNGGTLGTSADSMTIDVASGNTALSITLGAGTTSTINTGKYDTASKTFTNTATEIVINNVISGDGALKKAGAGTLTLNGNNTFSGGVKLEAGTLELGHNNALGTGTYSALIVTGNSELKLGGGLNVANNVLLENSAETVSLTINVAADTELSGGLISYYQNEIRKVGAGTLTLSGANQWFSHGTISIEKGTILAKSANALGAVAEASANKVRLSGGQLKVGSGVTLAQTNIEIVLSDAYSSTAAITGDGALATGTTITIADIQAAALAAESALGNDSWTFQIAMAGSTIADSLAKKNFVLAETLQDRWQISDYANGVLTISSIPEPSTFGLLAGLGALALAGTRRRRKKA